MSDKSFGYITEEGLRVSALYERQARKLAQDCANRIQAPVTLTGPIETLEPENEAK